MILTDTIYKGVSAVMAGALLAMTVYCGYLYVDRANTEVKLADKTAAYSTLSAAVDLQNKAIEDQRTATTAAFKRVDAALSLLRTKDAKMQPVIDFIKNAKGSSCSDAMPLIDAALRGSVK